MRVSKIAQSVIIDGQSGSGKTETTKIFLKYLCGPDSTKFSTNMINANYLLESFGNCCMQDNLNSSRFIKTIQVQYR